MWALEVQYEDGHKEILGPFTYQIDAATYALDRLGGAVWEMIMIKPPQ
jgi:hypothetical protein